MMPSPSFAALECRVGLGRLAVATEVIEVLGQYEVGARLPLTERISYAIGAWDGDVVLSLSLARDDRITSHTTSGLVLAIPGAAIRWAFEIVAPVGLVEVAAVTKPQSSTTRWLRTATLTTGGALQFVDLGALISDLDPAARERVPR